MSQTYPDSQTAPLGEKQLAWLREQFGASFFRDPSTEPLFKRNPDCVKLAEKEMGHAKTL